MAILSENVLCSNVVNAFQQLRQALTVACDHMQILDHALPAWCQAPAKLNLAGNNYREHACRFLAQLEYVDQQDPREILVGAGIMAASAETIIAVQALNQAKDQFKHAMLQLKDANISATHAHALLAENFEQLLPQRDHNLASSMARLGLARLHLKQCYRRVPILMQRPKKIGWTWANTRSIKKISIQTAMQMLSKYANDPGIEQQIRMLQGLDPTEKLAIVQDLAPHLRANLVLANGDRLMVKGPVPIFYLQEENLALPEFKPPVAKKGKDQSRVVRKDLKINPQPFLPAIRAHRYDLV